MTCSGVPLQAAPAERNHSTLFNLRPFNPPADSRFHITLNRRDAASCGEMPKLVCSMLVEIKTTHRLSSIQSRRERPQHSILKVSGHQPNARINPPPDANGNTRSNRTTLMKGKLRAVGLNELLGVPLIIARCKGHHAVYLFIIVSMFSLLFSLMISLLKMISFGSPLSSVRTPAGNLEL
jgi:hypothetical protein